MALHFWLFCIEQNTIRQKTGCVESSALRCSSKSSLQNETRGRGRERYGDRHRLLQKTTFNLLQCCYIIISSCKTYPIHHPMSKRQLQSKGYSETDRGEFRSACLACYLMSSDMTFKNRQSNNGAILVHTVCT